MLDLGRCFKRLLFVGGTNVRIIIERMLVHIFEESTAEIGQGKGSVEVDRCARKVRITRLHINFCRWTEFRDKATIDRPDFLIINRVRSEEIVAEEAIRGRIAA